MQEILGRYLMSVEKIIKKYKCKLAFIALVAKAEFVVTDSNVAFAEIKMEDGIPGESTAVISVFVSALHNKRYFEKTKVGKAK
jgi:hypothetical protein